jgi:hypothetical protein
MISGSVHFPINDMIACYLMPNNVESYIFLYPFIIVEHLKWFHSLHIGKTVAINLVMQVSVLYTDLPASDTCPRVFGKSPEVGLFLIFDEPP